MDGQETESPAVAAARRAMSASVGKGLAERPAFEGGTNTVSAAEAARWANASSGEDMEDTFSVLYRFAPAANHIDKVTGRHLMPPVSATVTCAKGDEGAVMRVLGHAFFTLAGWECAEGYPAVRAAGIRRAL